MQMLDYVRLNKQCLECLQLLNSFARLQLVRQRNIDLFPYHHFKMRDIIKEHRVRIKLRGSATKLKTKNLQLRGWMNHPARLVWKGHEKALAYYTFLACREFINRGHNCNIMPDVANIAAHFQWTGWPLWISDPKVVQLMQQSLRYKEVVDNANLVAQDKEPVWHYRSLWPERKPVYGYDWSTSDKIAEVPMSDDLAVQTLDWLRPDQIKKTTRKYLEKKGSL